MAQMAQFPLFRNITAEQWQDMRRCFGVVERSYRPGEVIYDFGDGGNSIGILLSGSAVVERIDALGSRAILEHLSPGGVFGEMLMFANVRGDSIRVLCEQPGRVCFMSYRALTRRCENACDHHSRLVENMFTLVADKATTLSERVEVLSRRSIRDKLLCYFAMQSAKGTGGAFTLPFTLSALADYISADRSAMMRELKKLRSEGVVEVKGRQVRLTA